MTVKKTRVRQRQMGAAAAAVSAGLMVYRFVSTKSAVAHVRNLISQDVSPTRGAADFHLFEFVRNIDAGNIAEAELDALTYVIQSEATGMDALILSLA